MQCSGDPRSNYSMSCTSASASTGTCELKMASNTRSDPLLKSSEIAYAHAPTRLKRAASFKRHTARGRPFGAPSARPPYICTN
jgi:hypothetical protein